MTPSVLATDSGSTASNTTFHGVVTAPSAAALGVQAGDGLVAFVSIDEAPSLSATPGWTIANQLPSGVLVTGAVLWRIADGVDDHLTITTGTSQMASWVVYRCSVEGAHFDGGASIAAASGATLNNAAWTPANGQTAQRLVFASRHADASSTGTPASPYADNLTTLQHANAAGATTQVDWQVFNGASYNPGAWGSVSPAAASVALTCGWEPPLALAASGAATSGGSASATMLAALAATGAGTSGGSAALLGRLALDAASAGTSTGTAALTGRLALAATGAATSTGSAAISVRSPLAADGAGTSGGSAALLARLAASSTGTGTSGGAAALLARLALSATGASTSGGSAGISVRAPLAATGAATSGGSAALLARLALAATAARTSTGSAALSVRLALAAAGVSTSAGQAALLARLALAASGAATSGGSAAAEAERILLDLDVTIGPTEVIAAALVGPTVLDLATGPTVLDGWRVGNTLALSAVASVGATESNATTIGPSDQGWVVGPTELDVEVGPTELDE